MAALIFQNIFLPLLPEIYAGHGLLKNDALVFHQQALAIAINIKDLGWTQWSLYPLGTTGNVGLLSGLYALYGPNPAYFIPFSAAAHALGATLLYRIGSLLWPGKIGSLGGLLSAIIFLVAPSSLQWYGQPLKDSFAIAGIFLLVIAWIRSLDDPLSIKNFLSLFLNALLGLLLVFFVRPYFIAIITQAFFLAWIGVLFWSILKNQVSKDYKILIRGLMVVCIILIAGITVKNTSFARGVYENESYALNLEGQANFEWTDSWYIPDLIDHTLKRAALLRVHFIEFNREVNAGSAIDLDRQLHNSSEVILYLPRALQVGLFSPFPESWSEKVTAPRVIAAIETSLWYLFVSGIVFLIYRRPTRAVFSCLVFCAMMVLILALIHPNVGTLYRQRFGFWILFLLCGMVGWASAISLLVAFLGIKSSGPFEASENSTHFHQTTLRAAALSASGALVIVITFICYLGFLIRDLLLVDHFGMQSKLDGFFIAAMVPMTLVTCLSLPLGDAITNLLIKAPVEKLSSVVCSVMTFATIFLGSATLLLVWQSKLLAGLFIGQDSSAHLEQAATLLCWFSPILFLSAWTVVGNAVMNALHRNLTVALAQLIVPLCSIGFILVDPGGWGVYAATIGMLVGTFFNGLILIFRCQNFKISLMPTLRVDASALTPFLRTYRWILLAAVFSAAVAPLNFLYAGSLGGGAISMWAMSGKLTQFIVGLISAGVASVLLPHFARLKIKESHGEFKRHAYLLLMSGSGFGALLVLIYCEFSIPIASILYSNNPHSEESINLFANLLRIGVLQMPPVICTGIVVKLTAATHTSSKSVLAIVLGLFINGALDFLLVPSLGILGIGLAATISSIFSAAYLVVHNRKLIGLDLNDILMLFFVWIISGVLGFIFML